jgi:hypothetical protein
MTIDVTAAGRESVALWRHVADVAELLPGQWVLVGGLMVQLHALEHGASDVRVTRDIDVLAQARPQCNGQLSLMRLRFNRCPRDAPVGTGAK